MGGLDGFPSPALPRGVCDPQALIPKEAPLVEEAGNGTYYARRSMV